MPEMLNVGNTEFVGVKSKVVSLLRRVCRLLLTYSVCAGTGSSWSMWRPVGMRCDAALSRTVRKIFSFHW